MWRPFALVTTLIAQLAWIGLCLGHHPKQIESSLRSAASQALATAGFDSAIVRFRGRDVELVGTVASTESAIQAVRLLRDLRGVRSVANRLSVEPPPQAELELALPYLEITARSGQLILSGSLPSAERQRELVQQALERFGPQRVAERLVVDSAADDGAAMARAIDLLGVAGLVVTGTTQATGTAEDTLVIRLRGSRLRLSGSVANDALRQRIEAQARATAPDVRVFLSTVQSSGDATAETAGAPAGAPEP